MVKDVRQHRLVPAARRMRNKVPRVTVGFWIVKVLATTVGETAADLISTRLGLGLTGTSAVMAALLVVALLVQFKTVQYRPAVYWLAVVLISIVGTLITDNLTDGFGLPLAAATVGFGLALLATFAAWSTSEKTLSIHTIVTSRREGFYWTAVLCTFALGTAAGDLTAERLDLGYTVSALVFGGLIAVVALAHLRFGLDGIPAFWIAYVLTRPLGASIGDLLSQPTDGGGLGVGTVWTSVLFLTTIIALVTGLAVRATDLAIRPEPALDTPHSEIQAQRLTERARVSADGSRVGGRSGNG